MLTELLHALLALDQTLAELAARYGPTVILMLAAVIFAETGLVVFPLLPGDSMLFLAGAVAATGAYDVHVMVAVLIAAAILGDSVNYAVGRFVGPRVFNLPPGHWFGRFAKREYLAKTQDFYRRYGAFTIVIGRFVPIVRTFAPFLAGVAEMTYRKFLAYNVVGGIVWVASLSYAGFLFGNIPWVKSNLTLIVIGIVVLSVMPIVLQVLRERRAATRAGVSGGD